MSLERALLFFETNKPVVEDQINYIYVNDWSSHTSRKSRKDESALQIKVLRQQLDIVTHIMEEAGDEFDRNKKLINFCKKVAETVEMHNERVAAYFSKERWMTYEGDEYKYRGDELDFQQELLKHKNTFREKLSTLNIGNELQKDVKLPIEKNKVIPLVMREFVVDRYPDIGEYIERKKV